MLLVLVAVAILTYASLVYFAEKDFSQEEGLNCTNWKPDYSMGNNHQLVLDHPLTSILYIFKLIKT